MDAMPPPSPPAARLRRPGLRDPRLLLGLVLVAGSVALGSWAVSAAARTVPVYAALRTVVPGEPLDVGGLEVREVTLGLSLDAYLTAEEGLPDDLVVLRTIGAGELVPRSAVAEAAAVELRPVAISPDGALPRGVEPGSTVDLWFVPEPADQGAGQTDAPAPYELAAGLTVAEVSEPTGAFSTAAVTVQVLVPLEDLADVLAALAAEGSVAVVHVPGASG